MRWFRPRSLLDQTFQIGIILKGLDGLLEVVGWPEKTRATMGG